MTAPDPDRVIAHLDMDAFFASVELLRHPELRGLPVVIGGRGDPQAPRGVVTTASYEARRFGVRSAMPIRRALELCPQAVLLAADFDEIKRMSRLFKRAIATLAPTIEDRGIDEVFIDLSAVAGVDVEQGRALAREIKHEVFAATGLTCSIGLAPNKLLAKLASELDKPDGLTRITLADVPRRIWPLPVRALNGIGPRAEARLHTLRIRTLGELAAAPAAVLVEAFGVHFGAWLHAAAHGHDARPVETVSVPQSRSREVTFDHDIDPVHGHAALAAEIERQARQVADELRRRGYVGQTIGIKLRFDDFRTVTRDRSLPEPTADAALIAATARACMARVPLVRRIRLLGVRVGRLVPAAQAVAPRLFD